MTEEELKEYLYILCGRNDIYIEECYTGYPQKEIEDKKWVQFESAVNKLILKNEELKNQLERAKSKLTTMFANGDDDKVLDDLLELGKILEVE